MLKNALEIAKECLDKPSHHSVWSPQLGKYVCPDLPEGKGVALSPSSLAHPPLSSQFKVVFLTAASGTLLFVVLCVALTFLAGKEPPPLYEKVVMGFFDLAKIGFGAIVGMLGGKTLEGERGKNGMK